MKRLTFAFAILAFLFCGTFGIAAQDEIADFYKGKSVRMVIGAGAGSGNDAYARLVSRHLGKHIPGRPTIVPVNMPGANGHISAAHIFAVAPKDGTTIGATPSGSIMDPLWGGKDKFNYDPTQMQYMGSAQLATYNCYIRSDAPVKTIQDAYTTEVIIGAAQEGSSTRDGAVILNNVLGTKFRIVSGYPGSREIVIAIERNEVQGVCGLGWDTLTAQQPDWIEKGFVRVLVQTNPRGNPTFDRMGVPRAIDLTRTPEDREVMELAYAPQTFGRSYVLPPGMSANRVVALRKAFLATMQDPDMLGEAQKMRVEVKPMSGDDMQEMVRKIYALPRSIIDRTREALIYKPRN